MKKKVMTLSGDSGHLNSKKETAYKLNGSAETYKHLRIGKPIGKPSVSRTKIVAAVRAVMKEDGMI